MDRIISTKAELKDNLIPLMSKHFELTDYHIQRVYDSHIHPYIDQIIDSSFVFLEAPYVDKVYRDSYYTYYSSKWEHYERDCIRLSFFDSEITADQFQNSAEISNLESKYIGFMIVRPTMPQFLGRSVIAPRGVKNNHFLCMKANLTATVNSIKFKISGFPHSSQDTETITCAETTLWALMEYYGSKYPEYKPVLPSKIIEVLKKVSSERQIPSKGLNIPQMAFALREFGFGTKIYSRTQYGQQVFNRLFSTYIESGIPLITAFENRMHAGGDIGHAVLTIGREKINHNHIDGLQVTNETDTTLADIIRRKNVQLFDNDDINKDFVFIDDNRPIYQLGKITAPAAHYPSARWHNCEITHFVVPLYSKVYLEAFRAKNLFKSILFNLFKVPDNSEIFIRFYLTSSRSFKHALAINTTFEQSVKDILLETAMPKFIWIAETSNKSLIKTGIADGIFLFDATQGNIQTTNALIIASYMNEFVYFDEKNKNFVRNILPLRPFSIFTNNLNGF